MKRLLIVSSNKFCAHTLTLLLGSPEVEISTITTDECVVEACRNTRFRLIIFLEMAPYFTSMNIITHIRRNTPHPPSIFVISTSHSESDILNLLECGVNQYITLPINIHRLRDKIYREIGEEVARC